MNIGGFCGILDIVIVVFAVLLAILGFKKGFSNKILGFASILLIIICAFVFAGQLSNQFKSWNIIYPNIYNSISTNVNAKLADVPETATTSEAVRQLLGWPGFLADLVVKGIGGDAAAAMTKPELAAAVSNKVTMWSMNVISWFIIVFGVIIILFIVKLIVNALRQGAAFRVVDGLLGVVFYWVIGAAIICVIFFVLNFAVANNWNQGLTDWLTTDMQLNDDSAVRLSKWIYNGNFLKNLWELIVGKIGK